MTDLSASAFIELVAGRRGHFGMESGYHSALWLDLDALFAAPKRVRPFVAALVDDVISAGSSLRATDALLRQRGADVVAVGVLLALGHVGETYFTDQAVPVEAVARAELEMWAPSQCPHCAAGLPLENVSTAA